MKTIFSRAKTIIKKPLTIVAIIVFVVIGFFVWKKVAASETRPQYQTAQVERGTLVVSVGESGQIVSTGSLPVTTIASGIVNKVFVKNGDPVTQGQEIMEITPDQNTLQNQTQAYASYQSAVNSYNSAVAGKITAQAQLEKDRASAIAAGSAVTTLQNNIFAGGGNFTQVTNPATKVPYTQNDIDAINSTLTSAQEIFSSDEKKYVNEDNDIAAASSAQASAWQSYQQSSTKVIAPSAGIINDLTYAPGMAISAGAATVTTGTGNSSSSNSRSTSTVAMVQTDATALPAATFNLSEVDMPKVHEGQHVTVTIEAIPDKTFTGTVMGVNREGAVSSGVTNYPVTIQLDSTNPDLAPNMSATANIITATKPDVLLIPSGAVQTNNDQSTVRVLKDGKVTPVVVEVGASSDTQTEITSGLNEGDTIVTSFVMNQAASGNGAASPFSRGLFGGIGGGAGGGGARGGGARGGGGGR